MGFSCSFHILKASSTCFNDSPSSWIFSNSFSIVDDAYCSSRALYVSDSKKSTQSSIFSVFIPLFLKLFWFFCFLSQYLLKLLFLNLGNKPYPLLPVLFHVCCMIQVYSQFFPFELVSVLLIFSLG